MSLNRISTSQPKMPEAPPPSMNIYDILYIVSRHRWKILICSFLGAVGATVFYFSNPPPFQSEAMLYIRYVMDSSVPGLRGNDSHAVTTDREGTIIGTEVEILRSMDLALEVADTIGTDKILAKEQGTKDRYHAAASIHHNLVVEPDTASPVIRLSFQSYDPAVVQPVLVALIDAYEKKHLSIHRGSGAGDDLLTQETDQLRSQLSQTEDELNKAKAKAGVISIDEAKRIYMGQEDRIEQEIFVTEADLAERTAVLAALKNRPLAATAAAPGGPKGATQAPLVAKPDGPPAPPADQAELYRNICSRITLLKGRENQLLSEFTDQNQRVKDVRADLAKLETQKNALEKQYPALVQTFTPATTQPGEAPMPAMTLPASSERPRIDLNAEIAQLSGLQSKIKVLNAQLGEIRAKAERVNQQAGTISALQRQEELQDADYKYYSEHLEASRIDETLTSGRALNIAHIQSPTPAHIERVGRFQTVAKFFGGGIAAGIAWAFALEMFLDRSIRRPRDVEKALKSQLFLSIPQFALDDQKRDMFHETLRDRLIASFESRGLTHNPKLIAVTGVGRNTGVTTIASGLARTLSDMGDSNVLLVDMTVSQGSAQQFARGKPVVGIDAMLETRETAQVQGKLYVVGSMPNDEKLSKMLPSRFSNLVPQLKASDFDYIIFDMPPVSQVSITPRLASFMDMVLMVVESEQTDQDTARQAADLLGASRAPVGIVLNKMRSYLPARLNHDFFGNA